MEGSTAFINKNEIHSNLKANVAYGGKNNADTVIIDNKIYKSRCEGIFVIEGGHSWIKKNEIVENNDGIVVLSSQPEINNNKINQNKRAGVIVGGESNPKIHDNEISNNGVVGVNIRDNSSGSFMNNMIKENHALFTSNT